MNDAADDGASRIAARGREALVARLRPAFLEAAGAHAEELELSDQQIEEIVQRAADRADGLQWRHALALVATEELGIGLGEALGHPAVARAQAIAGAPSYEQRLAELGANGETLAGDEGGDVDRAQLTLLEPREPDADAPQEAAAPEEPEEPAAPEEPEEPAAPEDPDARGPDRDDERSILRITAVHLGGIDNLAAEEAGLELRLSDDGVDISRGGSEAVRRLPWHEIHGLEVAAPRGARRRRRRDALLVVRTGKAEASFQIPGVTPEQLREQLAPALERHRRRP